MADRPGEKTQALPDVEELRAELERTLLEQDEAAPTQDLDGDLVAELSHLSSTQQREETTEVGPLPTGSKTDVFQVDEVAAQADLDGTGPHAAQRATHPDGYELLAEQMETEAAAATSARRAAVLLYELGRLFESHTDEQQRALAYYRASFERYPGLAVNARALVRRLRLQGDHVGAAHVLEAELNAAPSGSERAAILTERAMLRLEELGDLEGARADLLRVLDVDADDPTANELLIEIYEQTGQAAEAEQLLARRARGCEDAVLRSVLLCELARLRELQAEPQEDAATAYRNALNTDPTNTHALRSLLRVSRAAGDYPAVAKLCQTLASHEPPALAAATLWEAARLYSGRLRNTELALQCLEQACEHAPGDLALLGDLAALFEHEKRWEELAVTLEKATAACADPAQKALLGHRLARVRLERLHDVPTTIEALRAAVTAMPTQQAPRAMLGRLYARREHWDELVGLLREELELEDDRGRRCATLYRIADVYEQKLIDLPRARTAYEAALDLDSSYRPAVRGMSRVLRRLEQWEDLVALYERELAGLDQREERILVLRRISELWERRLGDPAAALPAYERLLAIEPSHLPALQALYRIYALGGRWRDLIEVLRSEADQTMDRWRRITLLTEIAGVQERRLEDGDEALATYLEVLGHAPGYQPALMAAGRLLAARGEHERLVAIHRQELTNSEDPQHRAWLLCKIGRILLDDLDRPAEAAEALHEAHHLHEGSAALDQLLTLYQRRGDDVQLAELLTRKPLPESPRAAALQHRRIAEALLRTDRPPLAVEHLQRALAVADDDAASDDLARLYAAIGDRQSLLALHQQQVERSASPEQAFAIWHKLALTWANTEHELHRAAEAYERILERTPRNPVVLRQLEAILLRLGHWQDLVSVIELAGEPSEDADYRTACALLTAALREHRLGELPAAAQSAVEVLERTPTHPEALATLERHARETGNGERLLQVLSRQVRSAQTMVEQAAALCAMAAVHGNRGDYGQAAELYRMATEQADGYLPAARGWYRAARELEAPEQMALAIEGEARATVQPRWRARCDFEAAKLWLQIADDPEATSEIAVDSPPTTGKLEGHAGDAARAALRRVLVAAPAHEGALRALSSLYAARREHAELAELFEHRVGQTNDEQLKRDLLARKADLQRSRLQDILGARKTIVRALDLFPDDRQLLSTLAELCRASADWEALVKVNRRLVQLSTDAVLLKALHFELGRIWEERLGQAPRAIAEYRRVLELDESDIGALTRLSELLYRQQDWPAAVEVTERLAQRDEDRTRVKGYHLRLAELYADGLGQLQAAAKSCRRALAMDPGDLEASERLAGLLERKSDARGLHAHLESCLTVHRARLDRDPFAVTSYRALQLVFQRRYAIDQVHVARSLLCGIGAATVDDFEIVRRERKNAPLFPRRPLTDDEIDRLLLHAEERGPLHQLLVLAEPVLRKIHGRAERSDPRAPRVTAKSHPRVANLLSHLTKALGLGKVEAVIVDGGVDQLRVEDTSPPTIVVGDELDHLSEDELRFHLARLLGAIRAGHLLPQRLGAAEFGRSVAALLSVTCTTFVPPLPERDLEELHGKLFKALSRRVRARLESPSLELSDRPFVPERWLAWMRHSQDRLALTVTGDVVAAIEVLKHEGYLLSPSGDETQDLAASASPRLRELLVFAVSDEYLTLRERLGLALGV